MNSPITVFICSVVAFLAFFFFINPLDLDLLTYGDLNAAPPWPTITWAWIGVTAVVGLAFFAMVGMFYADNKGIFWTFMIFLVVWVLFWLIIIAFLGRNYMQGDVLFTLAQFCITIGSGCLMMAKQNRQ